MTNEMISARRWIAGTVVVALMGSLIGFGPGGASEVITNETIMGMLAKTHGVMKDQRKRIHALMDALLLGDLSAVREQAEMIAGAMIRVTREFPSAEDLNLDQWRRMADVVEQAGIVREAAREGDYQRAYLHFSAMTGQCIECHQTRRSWGVFPVAKE